MARCGSLRAHCRPFAGSLRGQPRASRAALTGGRGAGRASSRCWEPAGAREAAGLWQPPQDGFPALRLSSPLSPLAEPRPCPLTWPRPGDRGRGSSERGCRRMRGRVSAQPMNGQAEPQGFIPPAQWKAQERRCRRELRQITWSIPLTLPSRTAGDALPRNRRGAPHLPSRQGIQGKGWNKLKFTNAASVVFWLFFLLVSPEQRSDQFGSAFTTTSLNSPGR